MGYNRFDKMMDKKAIRDTGILEQYLLGELSDSENNEIELLLKEDTELRTYFNTLEDDFEKLAFENAIDPPEHIKASIINSLEDQKIIPISQKKNNYKYLVIAASLATLFMISTGWLYTQWQESKNNLNIVLNETEELREQIVALEENLNETDSWYNAINNPNAIQLVLKGNQLSPNSNAITYVNHKEKKVILNPQGLASLGDDQTYQMWADVDGEMIDMGVIPADQDMIIMKYIDHAESINITIEPAGGNDHPTVEKLISNVLL
ncbi:anti-sigma factor [Aquimarina sp. MMG016]|uniref:anti-sigma factor n=1 Tax=Aquimarina sp. MMG016 TaxID=2822690 RepID=UPI001B3A474E|nr:anti-sigma factor [Aquimarina sp. MMG016]MBQ4822436.1 anti-sigma factor [Aquimarina sp. MMG016]